MTITLTVAGRIATVDATTHVVAGNTYPVTLALDSEWTGNLYLRVRFGSLYYDIPFASSAASVDVQMPVGYPEVGIGVFSEALEICTNEARVRLLRSILEAGEQVVEFDSDLYEQWAGEVTTLLTDDAFDAESTRPVQNAVLTAWKNTVPLDSALVHKTGNETIGGVKTFTSHLGVNQNLNHFSDADYQAGGIFKCQEVYYDKKDGSNSMVEHRFIYYGTEGGKPYTSVATRLYRPDRSGYAGYELRSYADHSASTIEPYYPVDGSGNPQPLPVTHLESSGNIAVDPRLVHTSGVETIAGAKTFTNSLAVKRDGDFPEVYLDTTYPYDSNSWKGRIVARDLKDGVQSVMGRMAFHGNTTYNYIELQVMTPDRTGSYSTMFRAHPDHISLHTTPYYPVDSGGNPQPLNADTVVLSGNLAVDPRLVHTTGNETVAGNKTFTGITFIDQPRFKQNNQTIHGNGEWVKFYEFKPVSYGGTVVIRAFQTYYIYSWVNAEIRLRQGNTSGGNPDAKFYNIIGLAGKLAKRASDGVVEVWLQNTTTGSLGVMLNIMMETGGAMKVATAVSQTAPAVGDTYSLIVDITNA